MGLKYLAMHTKYFGAHASLLMFWENTLAAARKYCPQRGKYFGVLLNYFDDWQELLVRTYKILCGCVLRVRNWREMDTAPCCSHDTIAFAQVPGPVKYFVRAGKYFANIDHAIEHTIKILGGCRKYLHTGA